MLTYKAVNFANSVKQLRRVNREPFLGIFEAESLLLKFCVTVNS